MSVQSRTFPSPVVDEDLLEPDQLGRQYSLSRNSFASVSKDLSRAQYEQRLPASLDVSFERHVVNHKPNHHQEHDLSHGREDSLRLESEQGMNYGRNEVASGGHASFERAGPPPPPPGLHPRPPSSTSGASSASSSFQRPPSTERSLDSPSLAHSHSSSAASNHPSLSQQPYLSLSRSGSNYTLGGTTSEGESAQYRSRQRSGGGGTTATAFFETALGYDDLLGPLPPSSTGTHSSSSSSNGTGRWNPNRPPSSSPFLSGESRSFVSTADMRRRDTSPSILQSTSTIDDLGTSRNEVLQSASSPRTRESSSETDETRTHQTRAASTTSYFTTGSGDSKSTTSSSMSTSASLLSPLSPLVEPFSPSTSLGSSNWGRMTGSKSSGGSAPPSVAPTSPLDLRTYNLPSLKQPQAAPQSLTSSQAFPTLTRRSSSNALPHPSTLGLMSGFTSPPTFAPTSTSSDAIRKFPSSLTLSPTLVGVPENSEMMTRVPSALYGPNLALGGNLQSTSNTALFHQDYLSHQQPHQSRSREGTGGSDYVMVASYPSTEFGESNAYGAGMTHSMSTGSLNSYSGAVGGVGSGMSPSASRDNFNMLPPPMPTSISSLSISNTRRDFHSDGRNGYPGNRQGYTEPPTRSGSVAGLATGAGGAGGEVVEEISTIFVVGFPDDMLEREFQNMFVFSEGFEAATLKHPISSSSSSIVRDSTTSVPPPTTKSSGATSPTTSGSNGDTPNNELTGRGLPQDPYGGMLGASYDAAAFEDAFGNAPLDSSVPSLPGGARDGGDVNPRKQIIGFAKFRTRAHALEARDIISGKRVDSEKGCVLKAEMAKKNLHFKRGGSNEPGTAGGIPSLQGLDASTLSRLANSATGLNPAIFAELARQSVVVAQQQDQQQQQQHHFASTASRSLSHTRDPRSQNTAAFEAFHSVPPSHPSSQTEGRTPREYYDEPHSPGYPSTAYFNLPRTEPQRGYSNQRDPSFVAGTSSPPEHPDYSSGAADAPSNRHVAPQSTYSGGGNSMMQQLEEGSVELQRSFSNPSTTQGAFSDSDNNFGTRPSVGGSQYGQHPSFSTQGESRYGISEAALLQQEREREQQEQRQFQQLNSSASFSDRGQNPNSIIVSPRIQYLPLGNPSIPGLIPGAPFLGPLPLTNSGIPRSQNPADMNAPKNTLYVGGLPAMLPNLAGAAHLEETLRNAFFRCEGFRRLCFRSKSNGPIVFVEFDNVIFATRALQDMYGNTLGGVVKGGIRLSYSKNPLGVRPNQNSNNNQGNDHFNSNSYTFAPPSNRRPSESIFGPGPALDYQMGRGMSSPLPPSGPSISNSTSNYRLGGQALSPSAPPLPLQFTNTFSPFGNSTYDQQ